MAYRRTNNKIAIFWLSIFFLSLVSCEKESPDDSNITDSSCDLIPNAGTAYTLEVPYFFSTPQIPPNNPLTVEGIELGRHLFWEKRLSKNNTVSCGSCHFPDAAFSDNNPFSVGLYGELTSRNSMALANMAWNTDFFWDGRAPTLEEQLFEPVRNPIEMDLSWPEAELIIGEIPDYQEMFSAAFGSPCVDSVRISMAMAQFIRTMISARSKFDRAYRYGEEPLSASELRGLELFLGEGGDPNIFPGGQNGGDCFHCHGGGLIQFTNFQFHNNGIDSVFTDLGRGGVTGNWFEEGHFKTPTLRNIELTAPYMHDGRFNTLHEVVEHYNSGGHDSPTLDPLMKFQGVGLGLSPQDIDDLVNFLESLTDNEFIEDERFHDPH